MKLNCFLFIVFLLNQYAICERFIVDVTYFMPPRLSPIATLCSGTVITRNHVLTTASCASVPLPYQVAITAHETLIVNDLPSNFTYTITSAGWVVYVHPSYIADQNEFYNLAVVVSNGGIGNSYVPRSLGGLQHNSVCSLHGWGGNLEDHQRESITVYSPQFCQPNKPQAYCTSFAAYDSTCTAVVGSPITCGNDGIVEGFLLNNRSCSLYENRNMLSYHSISDFRDWIQKTTEQAYRSRSSINFVVFVAQYTNSITSATVRCTGTIIASNRVLTTADCATVESPLLLSIESRGTSTSTTHHHEVTNILIHPDYKNFQDNNANIALLEINGSFRTGITPRLIAAGSLGSNSSCQLYGWGSHLDLTRIDAVSVYDPQFCDPTEPRVFCSTFTTSSHFSCDANSGSPITCGDESIIDGFLISNRSCITNNNYFVLRYHSVSEFRNWIADPTFDPTVGAGVVAKLSIFIILSALVFNSIK